MSLFKGILNSENEFTVIDSIRGVSLTSPNTDPAFISLETGDGEKQYLWIDNSDNLRMWTTRPEAATHDSGNIIAGSANAGADRQLSNLGTTAVNADVILNDNVNLSVGASADMTVDYDGTDIEIAFATANTVVNFGQTNPSDFILWGNAGTSNVEWDASVDELILQDGAVLVFGGVRGTNDGIEMYFDGTSDFHIDAVAADDIINIGASVDTDIRIHGGTAGSDVVWQADTDDLFLCDDTHLGFGDDIDMYLNWDASNLELRQLTPGTGGLLLGVDDAGVDVTFFSDTASDYMKWDADATNLAATALGALIFEDSFIRIAGGNNYDLAMATNDLVLDATDAATAQFILGSTGTNGLDVTFTGATSGDHVKWVATGTWTYTDVPVIMTGADSSGVLLTLTGIDTTLNSDTMLIDHSGDGYAINIDLNEATSDGIKIEAFTNHSVPMILLDANTNGFVGAADTGILTITRKGTQADVEAACIYIDNNGTYVSGGYGALYIDDDATAGGTDYSVYVHSNLVNCMKLETGAKTMSALTLENVAAATASVLLVDGDANGWLGADDTGLVHIQNDTAQNAGAALLVLDNSAAPTAASEGFMLRLVDTDSTGTADSHCAQILSAKNAGLHIDAVAQSAYRGALNVYGTLTDGTCEGVAGYFEGDLSGTATSYVYGMGTWLNVGSSGVSSNLISGLDVGIYSANGANHEAAVMTGMNVYLNAASATPPSSMYMMRFNCEQTGATPDGLFQFGNAESCALNTGSPSAANAYIPISIVGYTTAYIPVYIA